MNFCVLDAGIMDIEIMASIETVVQNAEGELPDDAKPDTTAELKDEAGTYTS